MVVVVLLVGILGANAAFEDSGDDISITNETFTNTTAGAIVELDDSNKTGAFYDNETTVFNDSDVEMVENTDYGWFESNGTLKILSGGDLAGDANGTISYSYDQTSAEQRDLATGMGALFDALPGVLFLAALVFLIWMLIVA